MRARPIFGARARGQRSDVAAEQLDGARADREVAADEVEERRLAGPVRAEDRAALAGRDVEVDVAHGMEAAEPPADPPQAEGRLGVFGVLVLRSNAYLRIWVVILPFATTLILPCHGVAASCTAGCVRPGGGLDGVNRPPND